MILIVYLIENESHSIKEEKYAESVCFDILAIGSAS